MESISCDLSSLFLLQQISTNFFFFGCLAPQSATSARRHDVPAKQSDKQICVDLDLPAALLQDEDGGRIARGKQKRDMVWYVLICTRFGLPSPPPNPNPLISPECRQQGRLGGLFVLDNRLQVRYVGHRSAFCCANLHLHFSDITGFSLHLFLALAHPLPGQLRISCTRWCVLSVLPSTANNFMLTSSAGDMDGLPLE